MALKTKSIGAVQKKTSVTDNLFNGTSGGLIKLQANLMFWNKN